MPKISVVLAVYNGAPFLAETLESILHQTFRDFEFIAVDDGSTDSTSEILASFQARDSRLIVKRNPTNLGIPVSRNLGCQLATGDYIAVTDADDISLAQRFERQVQFLEQHPEIALVGSSMEHIDEAGKVTAQVDLPTNPRLIQWMTIFTFVFVHSSIMMRRSAAASLGFYSEQMPVALDFDLVGRMSMSYQLANIPDRLVQYRISANNVSTRHKPLQLKLAAQIIQRLASHYLHQPISMDDANALRVMGWRDPYEDFAQLQRAASLLERLYHAYTTTFELSTEEARAIAEDAAEKWYGLARRCLRISPSNAVTLGLKGAVTSPRSAGKIIPYYARRFVQNRNR